MCELYFCITDEVSEYFLRFLADFYNLRGGKSLESVFYPAQIITTTDLNVGVGGGDDENDYATTADNNPAPPLR